MFSCCPLFFIVDKNPEGSLQKEYDLTDSVAPDNLIFHTYGSEKNPKIFLILLFCPSDADAQNSFIYLGSSFGLKNYNKGLQEITAR